MAGKHLGSLAGKPSILYTVEAAREILRDEHIIVSTDHEEPKLCVEHMGLKISFLRPKELATDEAGTYEVLIHTSDFLEEKSYFPDTLIFLQPASPFRTSEHIKEVLRLYRSKLDRVVSVKQIGSNPYVILLEDNSECFLI